MEFKKAICLILAVALLLTNVNVGFAMEGAKPAISIKANDSDSFLDGKFGKAIWDIEVTDSVGLERIEVKSGNEILKKVELTKSPLTHSFTYEMSKDEYLKSKLDNGLLVLEVCAFNINKSKAVETKFFKVDLACKRSEIKNLDNLRYKEFPSFSVTGTDENLKSVKVKVSGGDISKEVSHERKVNINGGKVKDGIYTIEIESVDLAGNVFSETRKITIDNEAPSVLDFKVEGEKNQNNFYKKASIYFRVSDTENENTYLLKDTTTNEERILASGEFNKGEFEKKLEFKETKGGAQNIELILKDSLGNVGAEKLSFFMDSKVPKIEKISHSLGRFTKMPDIKVEVVDDTLLMNGSITLTLKGEETRKITKVNEENPVFKAIDLETPLKDGKYDVEIEAIDAAGNKAVLLGEPIYIDTEKGEIKDFKVEGSINDRFIKGDINVSFLVPQKKNGFKMDKVECYINNKKVYERKLKGDTETISFKVAREQLEKLKTENSLDFKVVLKDQVEGLSGTEFSKTYIYDNVSPKVNIEGAKSQEILNKAPNLKITAVDDNLDYISYKITCDSEEIERNKVNKDTLELNNFSKNGYYEIEYKAVDLSENESESNKLCFIVDLEKVNIESKLENLGDLEVKNNWYREKVEFKGKLKDNLGLKKYSIYINDNLIESKNLEELKVKDHDISYIFDSKSLLKFKNREGLYKIKVLAEDTASNITENTSDMYFDSENPSLSFLGAEDGDFLNEVKDFTLKATDNVSFNKLCSIEYEIYRDNLLVFKDTQNKEKIVLSKNHFKDDGEYKVKAKTIDAAGNEGNLEVLFTIDKSLAKIDLNLSQNKNENGWYKDDLELNCLIKDNSYLSHYEVLVNGKSFRKENINGKEKSFRMVLSKEELLKVENEEGSYKVKVNSVDKAKNEVTSEIWFNADFKNPSLSLLNPDKDKTVNYVPDIKIENIDDHLNEHSKILYSVYKDDSLVAEREIKSAATFLDKDIFKEEGRYKVKAKTIDAASNISDEKETRFILDVTSPEAGEIEFIGSKSIAGWFRDTIKAKFTIKDNFNIKEFRFSVNDKEIEFKKDIKEKDVEILLNKDIEDVKQVDGKYICKIELTDDAGNKKIAESTFYANFNAPVLEYSGMKNGDYFRFPKDINLYVKDEHGKNINSKLEVKVYRDSKVIIDDTVFGKLDYKVDKGDLLDSGIYVVKALATDVAGNKSNLVSENFVIDNIAPSILNTKLHGHLSDKNWFNSSVELTLKAEDNLENLKEVLVFAEDKKVLRKVYEKEDKVKSKNYKVKLPKSEIAKLLNPDGTLNFKIKAKDFTENVKEKNIKIYVDYVKPKLEITGVKKNEHYKNPPSIRINSNELFVKDSLMEYEIMCDNSKVKKGIIEGKSEYTLNPKYFEKEGDYIISLSGMDGALNKGISKKVSFTIDKNSVKLSLSGVKPNIYSNKGETLNVAAFERYFKDSKVDILIEKTRGDKKTTSKVPFVLKTENDTKKLSFNDTGTYKVKAIAKDRVGHTSETKSLIFTIDKDIPKITKTIPRNISSYKDLVSPKFNIKDDYIDNIQVRVLRNGAQVNLPYQKTNKAIAFSDFKKVKENDGKYDIEVTAKDKSGNISKDKSSFIVNRFGARFTSQAPEKGFYKKLERDILVTANTPSNIIDHSFKLTLDNEKVDLGKAYVSGSPGSYKATYRLSKDLVSKEGFYMLDAKVKDSAGNSVTLKDENEPIEFAIDNTKPTVITNLSEAVYKSDSKKVEIDVKDNLALKNIKVYKDNKLVLEKLEKDLVSGSQKLDFNLHSGRNQEVKIIATDMAGNTEKYVKKVSIGENLLVVKPVYIAILCVLVLGCVLGFSFRRKRDGK